MGKAAVTRPANTSLSIASVPVVFDVPARFVGIDAEFRLRKESAVLRGDDQRALKERNWRSLREDLLTMGIGDQQSRKDAARLLQDLGYRLLLDDDCWLREWTPEHVTSVILKTLRECRADIELLLFGDYAHLRGDAVARARRYLATHPSQFNPRMERILLGLADGVNQPAFFTFASGKPETHVVLHHPLRALLLLTHLERSLGTRYSRCAWRDCERVFRKRTASQLCCCAEHRNRERQQRYRENQNKYDGKGKHA